MAERIHPLLAKLRAALKEAGNPVHARAMEAYMKSEMPMHGVPAPPRREILRAIFADLSWPDADTWAADVRAVWRGAKFREERYAALALCAHRKARPFQTPDALPLYEHLIVEGAWWDFVDEIASHPVGAILRRHPLRLHRARDRLEGILPAEGDRMGAAAIRPRRPGRSGALRPRERNTPLGSLEARSVEAPLTASGLGSRPRRKP